MFVTIVFNNSHVHSRGPLHKLDPVARYFCDTDYSNNLSALVSAAWALLEEVTDHWTLLYCTDKRACQKTSS
ncbi:hypothetical protein NQZ68_033667 [Dissostichus eleginoides]|nr:hypothetical protein NQZ68_033667 [Dissostichus eleginoides]